MSPLSRLLTKPARRGPRFSFGCSRPGSSGKGPNHGRARLFRAKMEEESRNGSETSNCDRKIPDGNGHLKKPAVQRRETNHHEVRDLRVESGGQSSWCRRNPRPLGLFLIVPPAPVKVRDSANSNRGANILGLLPGPAHHLVDKQFAGPRLIRRLTQLAPEGSEPTAC